MDQNVEIDGKSQRFQFVVLVVAAIVLLTTVIAVGALATNGSMSGFSIGDGDPSDNIVFSSESENDKNSSSESDESTSTDQSSDGGSESDLIGDSDLRDMFNAHDSDTHLPTITGDNTRSDQFSPNSLTSFVEETHFTVDSDRDSDGSSFWRTGTRDTYTGDGFTHRFAGDSTTFESLPGGGESGPVGSTQTDTVRLHQDASRIPIPGEDVVDVSVVSGANPSSFEFKQAGDEAIVVTDGDGNVKILPEGTQIAIETRDSNNRDDPFVEYTHYTDTSGVPDSVSEVSNDLMAGENAESNEEKAEIVTEWLRTEHEYRVDESHDSSDDAVETFLFEGKGGQSEHFATTATVLLREEGVPARVATGYKATGDGTGSSSSELGAMDQHAWVEVYTENGWVAYDPTPDDRETLQEDVVDGDESSVEQGVHEDVVSAWMNEDAVVVGTESHEQAESDVTGSTDAVELSPPYDISVSPDPVPGRYVTVHVSKDGTSVPGVEVMFNNESVGVTGPDGELIAQVPYTDSLTVTTREQSENGASSIENAQFSSASGFGGSLSTGATSSDNEGESASTVSDLLEGETYELPTEIDVSSEEVFFPGEEITATVTIDDVPVPGVDVVVDGDVVGTTNEEGEVNVSVPSDAETGDTVSISIERDELESETVITVAEPSVVVDTGLIALPGTEATISVVASDGGQEMPLENQSVTILDGDSNAVLDEETILIEGESTTIALPFSNTMTASTVIQGSESETVVHGLLYRVGAVAFVIVVIIGVGAVDVKRNGSRANIIRDRAYDVLFTVSQALHSIGATIHRLGKKVRNFCTRCVKRLLKVVDQEGAFTAVKRTVKEIPQRILRFISGVPSRIKSVFKISFNGAGMSNNPPENWGTSTSQSGSELTPTERIRGCWKWIARKVVGRSGKTTATTVEIEQKVVSSGFPRRPVTRIRKAFQRIEYGFADPMDEVDTAERSMEELRDSDESGGSTE